MWEAIVGQGFRYLAHLSAIFGYRAGFAWLWYGASSPLTRLRWKDRLFQKDRCSDEVKPVWKRTLAVYIKINVPNGEIVSEVHCERIRPLLPWRIFRSRNFASPLEHIDRAICVLDGLSNKAERMIAPPLFPLFFKSIDNKLVNFFLLTHQYYY